MPVLGVSVDNFPPHVLVLEEWVSEGSLWEYLRKVEKIPLKVQLDFASEIVVALTYLHNLHPPVAHRSLSSKTVMVSSLSLSLLSC
jgi:serine/threonine protein kinase